MTDSSRRRRRTRSVSGESQPILPEGNWGEEESDSYSQPERKPSVRVRKKEEETFTTRQGINEIRSELMEERNSSLIESGYWDETHSWGSDDGEASDDYWHFVGRYE